MAAAAAAAALSSLLQSIVELKHSADKFFQVLSCQIHHLPNASSDKIQTVEVHEGHWETSNPVELWNYTIGGRREIFKEKVEVDETSLKVTLVAIDGHVVERYQSYTIVCLRMEKFKSDGPPSLDSAILIS